MNFFWGLDFGRGVSFAKDAKFDETRLEDLPVLGSLRGGV